MAARSIKPAKSTDKPYPYYRAKDRDVDGLLKGPPKKNKFGKHVQIWVPNSQIKQLDMISNQADFFRLAIENAISLLTWAQMKEKWPEQYYDIPKTAEETQALYDQYNEHHPPYLEKARRGMLKQKKSPPPTPPTESEEVPCQTSSPKPPEIW